MNTIDLRALRLKKDISQDELSAKANISRYTISKIENGFSNPKLNTIQALANALDVPIDIFFTYNGNRD